LPIARVTAGSNSLPVDGRVRLRVGRGVPVVHHRPQVRHRGEQDLGQRVVILLVPNLGQSPGRRDIPGAQRHQHLPQGGSALHGQGGRGGGHPPGGAGDRVDSQLGVDHPTPDCYLRAITRAGVDGAQVPVDQQGRLVQSQQRPVQPAQCPRVGGCVEHLDGGVGDLTAADPECVQCATQRRCRAIGQDGDANSSADAAAMATASMSSGTAAKPPPMMTLKK